MGSEIPVILKITNVTWKLKRISSTRIKTNQREGITDEIFKKKTCITM